MGSVTTPRRTMTRGEIARVALALVDRDGVGHFSMRHLAAELVVTPMAVYHYFDSKAEVLQAAADQVWIEAALATRPHEDPVEELVQGMLTVRRAFAAHVEITPYAITSPEDDDAVRAVTEALAAQFERAGFVGEAAGDAYFVLTTYTLGSALMHAQRTIVDRAIRRPVSDLTRTIEHTDSFAPTDRQEATRPTYDAVRDATGRDPELVRFERGLRQVMAGLLDRR